MSKSKCLPRLLVEPRSRWFFDKCYAKNEKNVTKMAINVTASITDPMCWKPLTKCIFLERWMSHAFNIRHYILLPLIFIIIRFAMSMKPWTLGLTEVTEQKEEETDVTHESYVYYTIRNEIFENLIMLWLFTGERTIQNISIFYHSILPFVQIYKKPPLLWN